MTKLNFNTFQKGWASQVSNSSPTSAHIFESISRADGRQWLVAILVDCLDSKHSKVETIKREIIGRIKNELRRGANVNIEEALRSALKRANHEVFAITKGAVEQGASVAVAVFEQAVEVGGVALYLAYVGNCRAYRVRNGQARLLTTDHTWGASVGRRLGINPRQASDYPQWHQLTRYIGASSAVEVDFASEEQTNLPVRTALPFKSSRGAPPPLERTSSGAILLQEEDRIVLTTAATPSPLPMAPEALSAQKTPNWLAREIVQRAEDGSPNDVAALVLAWSPRARGRGMRRLVGVVGALALVGLLGWGVFAAVRGGGRLPKEILCQVMRNCSTPTTVAGGPSAASGQSGSGVVTQTTPTITETIQPTVVQTSTSTFTPSATVTKANASPPTATPIIERPLSTITPTLTFTPLPTPTRTSTPLPQLTITAPISVTVQTQPTAQSTETPSPLIPAQPTIVEQPPTLSDASCIPVKDPRIQLLSPDDGAQGHGVVTFSWSTNFDTLPSNCVYEWIIWGSGKTATDGRGLARRLSRERSATVDFEGLYAQGLLDPGTYHWGVRVRRQNDPAAPPEPLGGNFEFTFSTPCDLTLPSGC